MGFFCKFKYSGRHIIVNNVLLVRAQRNNNKITAYKNAIGYGVKTEILKLRASL